MTLIFAKVRLALLCRGTKYTGFVRKRLLRRRLAMRPLRVLNVAEKNDAAKELSRIMSRGQSHRVITSRSPCFIKDFRRIRKCERKRMGG